MWLSTRDRLSASGKRTWYHKRETECGRGDINRTEMKKTQHSDALNPKATTKRKVSLMVVASSRFVRAIEGLQTGPLPSWHNYARTKYTSENRGRASCDTTGTYLG